MAEKMGILGRKLGMTRIFAGDGAAVPVTVIQAGPCPVTQVKTDAFSRMDLADLKDKAETLPRKANEDAGLMARGILVNLGEMDIKNLHGPESYKAGLKLNHGRRPMVPLPN